MLNVKQLLKAGVELDDSRCLSALHTLYSITLSQAGMCACHRFVC